MPHLVMRDFVLTVEHALIYLFIYFYKKVIPKQLHPLSLQTDKIPPLLLLALLLLPPTICK